jgi:hypothetical protein
MPCPMGAPIVPLAFSRTRYHVFVGGEDPASYKGRSVKLSTAKLVVAPDPVRLVSPHRLEAQDTALSRRRHGFESRWGHLLVGQRASSEAEKLKC